MKIFMGCLLMLVCLAGCGHKADSVTETRLDNGITLLHQPGENAIVSAVILAPYGLADGPHHLSELMSNAMLRGTTVRTGQQFHEEIEMLGGRIHVETDLTQTLFWVQAPAGHFLNCFNLLCETVASPSFDDSEIEPVYERLLKAHNEKGDFYLKTKSWIDDRIRSHLFPYTPLGRSRYLESRLYTRRELMAFYQEQIKPDRLVIAVAGSIQGREIQRILTEFWPDKGGDTSPFKREVAVSAPLDSVFEYRDTDEPAMAYWAVSAPARLDSGFIAAHILANALRLNHPYWRPWLTMPDQPEHPLELRAYFQAGDSYGYFFAGVQRPAEEIVQAKDVLIRLIHELQENGLPDDLFQIAKRQLLFDLAYGKQFSLTQAMRMSLLHDSDRPFLWNDADGISRVEAVTLQDMNQVLKKLSDRPVVIVNMPH